ncbi:MAG: hypothetical protein QM664_02845 [Flavihumibacter sp.]
MPSINRERYQALRQKWIDKTISDREKEELLSFFADEDDFDIDVPVDGAGSPDALRERIFARIIPPPAVANIF